MGSHGQPETHPVLLSIAILAFIVVMLLGLQLHYHQAGHGSSDSAEPMPQSQQQ